MTKTDYIVLRAVPHRPSPGTLQGVKDAILDVLARHCVAKEDKTDRRSLMERWNDFKAVHAFMVEQLVNATFNEPTQDSRTPEQILIRVGMFCELRGLPLNTGGAELLQALNRLL